MVPYRIRVIVFDAAQPLCHIGLNTLYGCWHVPAITASGGWRVVLVARCFCCWYLFLHIVDLFLHIVDLFLQML